MDDDDRKSIVVTGEANTRMASVLALRSALKIEITTGMKHSKGRSARAIAQDFLHMPGRPQAKKVYVKLNEFIVDMLGADFDKPLP